MSLLTIRRANASDAKSLASIGHQAWRRGIAAHLPKNARDKIGPQIFEDFANSFPDEIVVAEDEDGILGFAATENGDNHVTDLWVSPSRQGKGIGSKLMARMEERARRRGYDSVELEVLTSNTRALSLYKYLGYRVTKRGMRMDRVLELPLHKTRLKKALFF